jgi:hypothetical protein
MHGIHGVQGLGQMKKLKTQSLAGCVLEFATGKIVKN